jgi:hypothetical protein
LFALLKLSSTATAKIDLLPRPFEMSTIRPYAAIYASVRFTPYLLEDAATIFRLMVKGSGMFLVKASL